MTNALDGLPLPVYGDGMQVRDWIHVDDHCAGIWTALELGAAGEVYNFGGGNEEPNMEITRRVLALTGRDASLVRHVEDRLGHDRRYALDTTRLRALGWEPRIGFEEGLAATVEWYRAAPRLVGAHQERRVPPVLRGAVREPLGDGEEWVRLADPVDESIVVRRRLDHAVENHRLSIERRRPRTRHAAGQRGSSAERSSREVQRGSSERRRLRSRRPHRASLSWAVLIAAICSGVDRIHCSASETSSAGPSSNPSRILP